MQERRNESLNSALIETGLEGYRILFLKTVEESFGKFSLLTPLRVTKEREKGKRTLRI